MERNKIQAIWVEHPDTAIRRLITSRRFVLFFGVAKSEIESGECPVRPVQKPGRRSIVLHKAVPSPFVLIDGKRECRCELPPAPFELAAQFLVESEKFFDIWFSGPIKLRLESPVGLFVASKPWLPELLGFLPLFGELFITTSLLCVLPGPIIADG